MKVLILYDDVPRDASKDALDTLVEVDAVEVALKALGHEVWRLTLTADFQALLTALESNPPDMVFNLVESVLGSGRLLSLGPMLLDHLGIPYTGCPSTALFITTDKLLTKRILRLNNLPTPEWASLPELNRNGCITAGEYIIKPRWEDASIGLDEHSVVRVNSGDHLLTELKRLRYGGDGNCFAEKYIDHREFNLSLLEQEGRAVILPPGEILFDGYQGTRCKVVGYRAKWDEESFEYQHTRSRFEFPREDSGLLESLKSIATRCWSLFELQGYARVDFRVDRDNQPTVLEINANPCLSPGAGFMTAAGQAGMTFPEVIDRIVAAAR